MDLSGAAPTGRERLKVVDAEYTVESSGNRVPEPIVHLFCRDADRNKRVVEVEGFRPYFMLPYETFIERTSDVINDRHVVAVEANLDDFEERKSLGDDVDFDGDPDTAARWLTDTGSCEVYHESDTFTELDQSKLVKVFTIEPSHVGKIREYFDQTYEADIPFERRFLISSGITLGCEIPDGANSVRYENWLGHSDTKSRVQEIESSPAPEIAPRMLVTDIEVATHGDGVPDPDKAPNEITAITAYDNYTEEYAGWILESEEWDGEYEFEDAVLDRLDIALDTMQVYDHEGAMLEDFNNWVIDRDFDLVTGWNSNWFDYPYIINRSYSQSAYKIREWDKFGNPGAWRTESDDIRMNVEGLVTFDMLNAYKKTQYRELRSYSLEDVAQAELGMGKEDIESDLDDAWHQDPVNFMVYNVRDVQAVVQIEEASSLLDLYDNMRRVTGALYTTCNHNGPMLDTLFLRQAYQEGVALTTNYEPDQGDYHGAWVAEPVPGKHDTVVYPDLASLYPYILWTLNISPETLFESKEAYRAAGYTDEQVFTAYIDDRDWKVMSSGETVEPGKIDKDQYKGVHDETGSRKKKTSKGFDGIFDPLDADHPKSKTPIYFVKPDVKEGFIRKTVDLLVDLKYEYKGQKDMYAAVKRVTNCFTPDTEVMTPDGIVNIRELSVGDKVYSIDNDGETVTTKAVTDVWEYPDYDDELITIQNSHTDFSVTPNHQMLVNRHRHTDEWESTMAGELNEYTSYRMPSDWSFDDGERFGETIDLKQLVEQHTDEDVSVRTDGSSEYIAAKHGRSDLPRYIDTDQFVELLGWYITEGSTYDTGNGNNYVMLTQDRGNDADRIESLLDETVGNYWEEDAGSHGYRFSSHLLASLFENTCGDGSENKQLPGFVFEMSSERKKLLFDTLIRGDGDRHSGVRYTTVSEQLKDDFSRLCVHVGRNPRIRTEPESSTNHMVYRIRCSKTENEFRMHRDGGTDTADNGVYCVTVEDNHTLMAGRNGNFQFVKQSVYGVLGDSASGGVGFRLFDWRLAESITLGGQMVINYTADKYIELINQYSTDAGYEPNSYLVGGDTDSVMTAIPQAPDYKTALEWSQKASEQVSGELYDQFMEDEFNVVQGRDEHKMDVEIESLGSSLFFMDDDSDGHYRMGNDGYLVKEDDDEGVKKRYAQHLIWDEDDGWLDTGYDEPDDPDDRSEIKYLTNVTIDDYEDGGSLAEWGDPEDHIGITGFEYVRSDSAIITVEAQERVLTDILLADDVADRLHNYLSELRDDALNGSVPIEKLGRPKGISKALDDYGWKTTEELRNDTNYTVNLTDEENGGRYVSTPGPTYRGRKYAVDHFTWEDGDQKKCLRLYVEQVRGDEYPAAYEYDEFPRVDRPDSPEVGRPVDAITVEKVDRIPDVFVMNREKMMEKELKDKIEPIIETVGHTWDDVVGQGRQTGLDAFK